MYVKMIHQVMTHITWYIISNNNVNLIHNLVQKFQCQLLEFSGNSIPSSGNFFYDVILLMTVNMIFSYKSANLGRILLFCLNKLFVLFVLIKIICSWKWIWWDDLEWRMFYKSVEHHYSPLLFLHEIFAESENIIQFSL